MECIIKIVLRFQNAVLSRITKLLFEKAQKVEPKNILILRTCLLGDFIFAVPSMVALRRRFPESRIVLLTSYAASRSTSDGASKYLSDSESMPWLTFVVPDIVDESIQINMFRKSPLNGVRKRVAQLAPDICIILSQPSSQFAGLFKKLIFLKYLGVNCPVYGWRIRANHCFFKWAQFKSGLFEHKVIGPLRSVLEVPQMPSFENIVIEFSLTIDAHVENWAANYWEGNALSDARVVAIAPGSIQPHKCWPADKFVALCTQLMADYHVKIIIVGAKGDYDLAESFRRKLSSEIINLAGKISVSQSAALLKRCVLLVGNDGGAMHLGAAVGCPTVSIVSGIEFPGSVEPWGNCAFAVRHDVECAPCYSFTFCPKKHNMCILDLPVESVFRRCRKVLGSDRV